MFMRLRNPLAFPGGSPGLDLSHIAYNGNSAAGGGGSYYQILLSAVALSSGVGFLRLNRAFGGDPTIGTQSGAATAVMDSIGPTWRSASSGGAQAFSWAMATPASQIGNQLTFAAICRPSSLATSLILSIGQNVSPGQAGLIINNTGTCFALDWGNVNYNFTNLVPVINHPYFVLASTNRFGTTMNGLMLDLSTGVMVTQSLSPASSSPNIITVKMMIGNWVLSPVLSFPGGIAAAAMIISFLTIPNMLAWAKNPWDFWYPPIVGNFLSMGGRAVQAPVDLAGNLGGVSSYG